MNIVHNNRRISNLLVQEDPSSIFDDRTFATDGESSFANTEEVDCSEVGTSIQIDDINVVDNNNRVTLSSGERSVKTIITNWIANTPTWVFLLMFSICLFSAIFFSPVSSIRPLHIFV